MDDEEDIIFDQTTLLTRRIKTTSLQPQTGRCFRIFQTLLLCSAFFGLGLCIAMPGPTLLDLQARTHTNMSEITQIFTGRSVGYLIGSALGGFFYDRFNQNCLLFFSLILTAVGTALAPWSHSFFLLMGFFALQGVSMGFLDTGGNVLCVTIWGRKSPPYMQAMHFSFGLGAFVAPLLAEPFLMPLQGNTTNISMLLNDQDEAQGIPVPRIGRSLWTPEIEIPMDSAFANYIPGDNHKQIEQRNKRDTTNSTSAKMMGNRLPTPKKPITDGNQLSTNSKSADGTIMANKIKNAIVAKLPTTPPQTLRVTGNNSALPNTSPAILTTTVTTSTTRLPTKPSSTLPPKNLTKNNITPVEVMDRNVTQTNKTLPGTTLHKLINQVTEVIQKFSNVQFAYLTIALYLGVLAVCFLCVCCVWKQGIQAIRNEELQSEYLIRKETRGFRVQILVLLFFFYFLYVGMEVTYGGLILTFAVKYLGWTKSQGTLLTSVFWGSFALARGVAIFFGMCMSPALMLIADLVLTCLALAGLVMGLESNHLIIWFCTAILGAGMASIFPAGITWAERYMHITGKATSVFVVGSALGEMIVPALTGFLFEAKGPMWLLYIMLGSGLLSAVLYIIMQNLASNKGERYEKLTHWLGSSDADSGGEEQDIEMDMLDRVASSSTNNLISSGSPKSNTESKKKVSFKLPKDLTPKSIANRYRPSFLGKHSEKAD